MTGVARLNIRLNILFLFCSLFKPNRIHKTSLGDAIRWKGFQMIFVKLGKLMAWALLVLGTVRLGMSWFVSLTFTEPVELALATSRYIGPGTTGQAADQGLMWIGMGIVVGLLVHIAEREAP